MDIETIMTKWGRIAAGHAYSTAYVIYMDHATGFREFYPDTHLPYEPYMGRRAGVYIQGYAEYPEIRHIFEIVDVLENNYDQVRRLDDDILQWLAKDFFGLRLGESGKNYSRLSRPIRRFYEQADKTGDYSDSWIFISSYQTFMTQVTGIIFEMYALCQELSIDLNRLDPHVLSKQYDQSVQSYLKNLKENSGDTNLQTPQKIINDKESPLELAEGLILEAHTQLDFKMAMRLLNQAMLYENGSGQIQKRVIESYWQLAEDYIRDGVKTQAIECFTQILSLDENDDYARLARGKLFFELNQYDKARQDFHHLIESSHVAEFNDEITHYLKQMN